MVDVREPFEGEPVGDLQLPGSVALELLARLDPGPAYVLVCPQGRRSRALAGELRNRGYRAWSLRGGLATHPLHPPAAVQISGSGPSQAATAGGAGAVRRPYHAPMESRGFPRRDPGGPTDEPVDPFYAGGEEPHRGRCSRHRETISTRLTSSP